MKILFINACVREHSRTLLLARHLLSRIPAEVTEIRLEKESIEPLTKERLAWQKENGRILPFAGRVSLPTRTAS